MTSILGNGATQTIYISENAGTIFYRINNGSNNQISSWPATVTNTNPGSSSILKILFETNITLTSALHFFVCGSQYLQFGSTSLNSNGTRYQIIIDGVSNYPGLIRNGIGGISGVSNIFVYNLQVSSNGSTLADYGGWIGQTYFGDSSSENYIVNCSSDGDISNFSGGIVGAAAGGSIGGSLTIRGCSSHGTIGSYAGGIAGNAAGASYGSITCEKCWSEGDIGLEAGGIYGSYGGTNRASALALSCYSLGTIISTGGGIFGAYGGESIGQATAQNCYSRGQIQANSGGIFGINAAFNLGTTNATNCYSLGNIATSGNGIYGTGKDITNSFTTSCYSANGSWSDSTANSSLTGFPTSSNAGSTWVRITSNTPYLLNGFGYTPYTNTIIDSTSQPIQSYSQSVEKGQTTVEALNSDASGNAFAILDTSGGDAASRATITMNIQTGAIRTTSATKAGTYTILLYSIGSYNITLFYLTVTEIANLVAATTSCCQRPQDLRGADYTTRSQVIAGNTLIGNANYRRSPLSYKDLIQMNMAQAFKR